MAVNSKTPDFEMKISKKASNVRDWNAHISMTCLFSEQFANPDKRMPKNTVLSKPHFTFELGGSLILIDTHHSPAFSNHPTISLFAGLSQTTRRQSLILESIHPVLTYLLD